ncbi:MAG TPA: hypothetical protein VMT76_07425 [Puia sp.]|nr:hypothetical protein [Puia sp.]
MRRHFTNDAERATALKQSRWLVTGILVLLAIAIAAIAYRIIFN